MVITVTTVGYGDVAPVTGGGRLFLVLYACVGLPLMVFVARIYGNLFLDGLAQVHALVHAWRTRKHTPQEPKAAAKSTGPTLGAAWEPLFSLFVLLVLFVLGFPLLVLYYSSSDVTYGECLYLVSARRR